MQYKRGLTELDRTRSWTYKWESEDDLQERGDLIAAYTEELGERRAAGAAILHTAGGSAAEPRPAVPLGTPMATG